MLMADPASALRETRRVLRDGGRLAFSVWATPERNPWAFIPGRVMVERGHIPPPEPGAPGIFAMADPDRSRELVTSAGFDEPQIEVVEMAFTFEDFDQYWDFLVRLAGALAMTIAALPADEQDAVREAIREAVGSLEAAGGYRLSGACLNAVAS
jgi:SAM-dependent methyltransferase